MAKNIIDAVQDDYNPTPTNAVAIASESNAEKKAARKPWQQKGAPTASTLRPELGEGASAGVEVIQSRKAVRKTKKRPREQEAHAAAPQVEGSDEASVDKCELEAEKKPTPRFRQAKKQEELEARNAHRVAPNRPTPRYDDEVMTHSEKPPRHGPSGK